MTLDIGLEISYLTVVNKIKNKIPARPSYPRYYFFSSQKLYTSSLDENSLKEQSLTRYPDIVDITILDQTVVIFDILKIRINL